MALSTVFVLMLLVGLNRARPPLNQKADSPIIDPPPVKENNGTEEWDKAIEYKRYLKEVVQVLESDPEFRKKLETMDIEQIRDGSIANELDFVGHHVRNKLDDIKRQELERLRHLAVRMFEQDNGIDREHIKIPGHLEFEDDGFGKEDLKKLILATTKDLEEADKKRREEYKHYEMEKRHQRDEHLRDLKDDGARLAEEQVIKGREEKHKKHERPHHPLSKDQLEEVWEEKDGMKSEDFKSETFFSMHDINGDGFWDQDEIKMLFEKELDKVYDKNNSEDDMMERGEEMERMREHVFSESDKDGNNLISYEEFLSETKKEDFEKDQGWDTLDDEDPFSDEEFRAYEMQRQRELQDYLPKSEHVQAQAPHNDIKPHANLQHPVDPQKPPRSGIPGQPAYTHGEGVLPGGGAKEHDDGESMS